MRRREKQAKEKNCDDEKTLQRSYTDGNRCRPFHRMNGKVFFSVSIQTPLTTPRVCVLILKALKVASHKCTSVYEHFICVRWHRTLCNMFFWCVLISEIYILFNLYLCCVCILVSLQHHFIIAHRRRRTCFTIALFLVWILFWCFFFRQQTLHTYIFRFDTTWTNIGGLRLRNKLCSELWVEI